MGDSEAYSKAAPLLTDIGSAGTLDGKDYTSLESILASKIPHGALRQDSGPPEGPTEPGEEQALESHEVIELQAFSKRKEWIVEKIKFLGNMPPIELFAGLDAIRNSADVVPGLPTRDELQRWLVEHDKIEKETEIFDSGELKKFKKFTKAAAKRNLSPEDTDIIELTLTTIYEFDKLLHLLRDRTAKLDLLGVRLTWEEQRKVAWEARRSILTDLQKFLATRARWSHGVYDVAKISAEASPLRGSIISVASDASTTSSLGFSRTVRFKLAEALSRDAAMFASRISSLRHGSISVAGKALDKLIDNSRKPVPDELLDEQDRLEDQGINEMENVGKFVMSVVTQWRKADEFYVETAKDEAAAQALQEEIETAKLSHPSARQDAVYMSRANAISKRLWARDSPASATSSFPRPTHSLFPEQTATNNSICQVLSSELSTALGSARVVEKSAQEYHATFEAVKRVETLCSSADDLVSRYNSVVSRLQDGVAAQDGDGAPPDLSSEACLDTTQHNSYLALLPSILLELDAANQSADSVLPNARAALLSADQFVMDPVFKTESVSSIERLASLKDQARGIRDDVTARVNQLREVRRVWVSASSILRELEAIRGDVGEAMERHRWRSQTTSSNGAPLTPESPVPSLPVCPSPAEFMDQLQQLGTNLSQDVLTGLTSVSPSLEPQLRDYMARRCGGLSTFLNQVRQMVRLGESIQKQASVMSEVRNEMHALQVRLEDLKGQFELSAEAMLDSSGSNDIPPDTVSELDVEMRELQEAVQEFTDKLPRRVMFVTPDTSSGGLQHVKRRFSSSGDYQMNAFSFTSALELPFDLPTLDDAVRTDSNAYTLALMAEVSSVQRKANYLHLAQKAREVDSRIDSLLQSICQASDGLGPLRTSLASPTELGRR